MAEDRYPKVLAISSPTMVYLSSCCMDGMDTFFPHVCDVLTTAQFRMWDHEPDSS